MKRTAVVFQKPGHVRAVAETAPPVLDHQVRVRTQLSAISAGTELRVYRGEVPLGRPLDPRLEALEGNFRYPLRYGYSAVGTVEKVGARVDPSWLGRSVFAFHPHCSVFSASPESLLPLPEDLDPGDAVFLPNMETAVNLMLDGRPRIGERVVVFGQGVVGLLTTALLSRYPLEAILTLDRYPARRQASREIGAAQSYAPENGRLPADLVQALESPGAERGADLVFELSGSPPALDQGIACCGFHSRIVVGSWYGTRRAALDLGADFHRNRIRLVSSQVSTVAPENTGRWSKTRQMRQALLWIRELGPSRWITQRFDVRECQAAYSLLDESPQQSIQVVLTYDRRD